MELDGVVIYPAEYEKQKEKFVKLWEKLKKRHPKMDEIQLLGNMIVLMQPGVVGEIE